MNTGDASSAVAVNALVFSGGEIWCENEPDMQVGAILQTLGQSAPGPSNTKPEEMDQPDGQQNVSTYVRVFEDMVSTVIKEETHLLDDNEFALLTVFAHLSYNARFLMVRLLLRKQDTWHRLDNLKYESELGSVSAIVQAMDELCQVGHGSSSVVKKEESEEQEIVDLVLNDRIASLQQEQEKQALVIATTPELSSESRPLALAQGEQDMDLKSLLDCMRTEELKAVAKQMKLKTNSKKEHIIRDLLSSSSSQSTITDFVRRAGTKRSKGRGDHQTKLSSKLAPQQARLREIALLHIVKCIRVDEDFFGVIHRVNLVYFRITQFTPGILVTALLTRFGKRAYPGYKYERTRNIWPSRQALLEYEEVLNLEGQVDTLLAGNVPLGGGRVNESRTPAGRFLPTPITPGSANSNRGREDEDAIPDIKPGSNRVRGARIVKDIFEQVYPRWQDLVKTIGGVDGRTSGLDRFHCGHVLTRVICKGSVAFGILGEHDRELDVLEALLAQKRWRRGQRGRWYERRALILSTHHPKNEETTERALDAVIEALVDPDTHIVYRPKLQRRLKRLENKLKIPMMERHTCDGVLMNADEVVFEAIRLKHRAASLKLDRTGRCLDAKTSQLGNQDIKCYYSPVIVKAKSEHNPSVVSPFRHEPSPDVPKGKSLWLGQNGEELSVEALALQRYGEHGFKGVHCETRVIAMLFSLLFWDIIFEPIPGAFETPYQTAPLDIAEDSFYHSRKDSMENRLAAIEAGKGADIVRVADAQHRASGTWCVGVQWDLFSSQDLIDIVTCIGGKALSVICRVLCEDYTFGTSGGPDLFLWNVEKGICKFAEVKGPGDTLQENQRVWIDILLKAPVTVEICRVVESGNGSEKKSNTRTPKGNRKKVKTRSRKEEDTEADMEESDVLPTMAEDQDTTLEDLVPAARIGGTLKRKTSPGVIPPTPSKRSRAS